MTSPVTDLAAVKAKQQQTWASGDYSAVAARLPLISELLIDAADLPAGSWVLDVAGGSGNAALAAARAGCDALCTDYVVALLERARERADAEGLAIETREADAESLPFDAGSFDAVTSAIGVMFAPDQERAAAELLRVCRPGGTIALASWTPDSLVGELFRSVGAHVPPPAGVRPPTLWGSEERLGELLGDGASDMRHERRTYSFRFRSPEEFVDFFRDNYGPTHKAFAALDDAGRAALYEDLAALARRLDRLGGDGPVAIASDYLETIAIRSG